MKKDLYPELMTERELAESFRELEIQMRQEVLTWLQDPDKRVEFLEQLMESDHVQYRCAILLMLARNADKISSDWRLFLLPYLIELLSDDSGSIRKGALNCSGYMIAREYEQNPSVWQECLHTILFDSKKREEEPAGRHPGNALTGLLKIVYDEVSDSSKTTVLSAYCSYFKSTKWGEESCVCLLKGALGLPYSVWGAMQRGNILGFVRHFLKNDAGEIRLASLLLLDAWMKEGWKPAPDFAHYLRSILREIVRETAGSTGEKGMPAQFWLAGKVLEQLPAVNGQTGGAEIPAGDAAALAVPKDTVLFREDLDSELPGLFKQIDLQILSEKFADGSVRTGLSEYASHLVVFMRLNTEPALFTKAGDDLLNIIDHLDNDQKKAIMTELFKCVALEDDSSHYLPYLIGECWKHIPVSMQRELVPQVQRLCNSGRIKTVEIIMGTVCRILAHLSSENPALTKEGFLPSEEEDKMWIRRRITGMLCQGIYSDRRLVAENTAFSIGYDLFRNLDGSTETSSDVREPLVVVSRSVLLYMRAAKYPDPLYRYPTVCEIARYLEEIGHSYADPKRPVAYFSGSFDPFSSGHRAVAREVSEMGYQVYVNVDDFSLNRNTQPLAVRRKIVMLSIADLPHVRIFPYDLVINPDNPADLARLRALFPGQKVYLVCGSDRIEKDAAYRETPSEGSVHSFPHIVFTRSDNYGYEDEGTDNLTGEVIRLMLPAYYEHMTSVQIRRNLQEGKSIDDLVAIPAQQYIRRHKLYADDRIYKKMSETRCIETRIEKSEDTIRVVLVRESGGKAGSGPEIGELTARVCAIHKNGKGTPARDLEILSLRTDTAEAYTEKTGGTLLDEALLAFQSEGIDIVYLSGDIISEELKKKRLKDLLNERGFVRLPGEKDRYCTDLRSSLVLFGSASESVLDPYCDEPSLLKVRKENLHRLRVALAGLYPGKAVLFIDGGILNYRLSKRIRERSVSVSGSSEGASSWICVPYGKTLKYVRIPDVTTMALNTEKVYVPDLSSFSIKESAGYPNVAVQLRNIKSMGKPFVLVDNFYHNGFRMDNISLHLEAEGFREEMLLVGAISRQGRELAKKKGLSIDSIYEIPNLKAGILESDMTPFYGGDRVMQKQYTPILPSIYPIMPYQMPLFLRDAPYQAVYELSMVCLENAKCLFEVLETLYEKRLFRKLTLERLGEVIDNPGCPETVAESADARGKAVSDLLSTEITRLKRFRLGQQ